MTSAGWGAGPSLRRMSVSLLGSLLTACGGGGDANTHMEPTVEMAQVAGCGAARAHDSGRVLYLTVASDCAPTLPLLVRITVRTNDGTTERQLSLSDFGQRATIQLDATARRNVSVHRRGTWREINSGNSWSWRDGAGLLAKDGGLYLLGGWSSDTSAKNDVWFSADLDEWQQLTAAAPWAARHGAGWVVHQDKLWVIGGDLIDDVWSSSDGVHWEQVVKGAPFGKRYTPIAVSDGRSLFVYQGQVWQPYDWCAFAPECTAQALEDVWRSDDGRDWHNVLPRTPWQGRALVHGGAFFNGRIYVVGGGLKLAAFGTTEAETIQEFSDIWSSPDGVQWRKEANFLGFEPRTHFALAATPHGCYVANGSVGRQNNTTSDVFHAPDCVNFAPLPRSGMGTRHASSLTYFNGSIIILGGHFSTAGTTIWQYFPDTAPGQ